MVMISLITMSVSAASVITAPSGTFALGETRVLPVTVAGLNNASGVCFNLTYNQGLFTVDNVTISSSYPDATVTTHINNATGLLLVAVTDTDGITATGATPLVDIKFRSLGGSGTTSLTIPTAYWSDSAGASVLMSGDSLKSFDLYPFDTKVAGALEAKSVEKQSEIRIGSGVLSTGAVVRIPVSVANVTSVNNITIMVMFNATRFVMEDVVVNNTVVSGSEIVLTDSSIQNTWGSANIQVKNNNITASAVLVPVVDLVVRPTDWAGAEEIMLHHPHYGTPTNSYNMFSIVNTGQVVTSGAGSPPGDGAIRFGDVFIEGAGTAKYPIEVKLPVGAKKIWSPFTYNATYFNVTAVAINATASATGAYIPDAYLNPGFGSAYIVNTQGLSTAQFTPVVDVSFKTFTQYGTTPFSLMQYNSLPDYAVSSPTSHIDVMYPFKTVTQGNVTVTPKLMPDLVGEIADAPVVMMKDADNSLHFNTTFIVKNIGYADVTNSFDIQAKFGQFKSNMGFSDDIPVGKNLTLYVWMNVDPEATGTEVSMYSQGLIKHITVLTGGNVTVGAYEIGMGVDVNNDIAELNETNNYVNTTSTVLPYTVPKELRVSSATGDSGTILYVFANGTSNFVGANIQLTWDPAVMSVTNIQDLSGLGNFYPYPVPATSGSMKFYVFGSNAFTGNKALVAITCNALVHDGSATVVQINSSYPNFELDERVGGVATDVTNQYSIKNGTFTTTDIVPPVITIITPTNGAAIYPDINVTADITDKGVLNATSITVTIDGVPATIIGKYQISNGCRVDASRTGVATGSRNIVVSARDNVGNTNTSTITVTIVPFLLGDANDDGVVDPADALRIIKYRWGLIGTINLQQADVNKDGHINVIDAYLTQKYNVGSIPLGGAYNIGKPEYSFTTTNVSEPTVVVVIPNLSISTASRFNVPIIVQNVTDIAAIQINLTYNRNILNITGISQTTGIYEKNLTPGNLILSSSYVPQFTDAFLLANVSFETIGKYGDTTPLVITAQQWNLNEEPVPIRISNGYVSVTDPIISIQPRAATVSPGSITTYTIVLDNASQGLSGYNLTLAFDNTSAKIVGVTYPAWASMPKNSTLPADRAWFKATDLIGNSGTRNITLCTITVRGDEPGMTTLIAMPDTVEHRNGGWYIPSVVPATLTIGNSVKPFPKPGGGFFPEPTDPNHDGKYEDIDGNGWIGFNDVVVLYQNMEAADAGVYGPVVYYDYDNSGFIGFNDVVRLYGMT